MHTSKKNAIFAPKMKLILHSDMAMCTEEDVSRLLPLVSQQRREQALRFTHLFGRWTSLKAYELLLRLLYPDTPPEQLQSSALPVFEYNEFGRPFIPDGPCFSISHCREAVAVAISDTPIGVDVESIRRFDPELVKRTMNEEEQRSIFASHDPARAFIRLWTQKEAVLKLRGTGIVDNLADVLSDSSLEKPSEKPSDAFSLRTTDYPHFILSVALLP